MFGIVQCIPVPRSFFWVALLLSGRHTPQAHPNWQVLNSNFPQLIPSIPSHFLPQSVLHSPEKPGCTTKWLK